MTDTENMKLHERLDLAKIVMSEEEIAAFEKAPDVLSDGTLPKGYKKCSRCGKTKKITLFNKNKMAKDGCTAHCKECQKKNAQKSYEANRHKRTYKAYYQKHKEEKRERSRAYYAEHKEELARKHAAYRATPKGRKAMDRAHAKRAKALKANVGIPYTRAMVIDRDKQGGSEPICYLCGKPITGTPHLDHVIPVVMGGNDCFTNIACVHDECNLRKSKDAREITDAHVDLIMKRSDAYMESHKELFPDIFGSSSKDESD